MSQGQPDWAKEIVEIKQPEMRIDRVAVMTRTCFMI